ncbi:hypothetical protein [Hymenobacter properus]|uniref:Uncharacterized protein n=1 Tax=Hymenobacter properus TaxID=2791026 RepID=A0A931FLP6_9BACT|nr:hypothetical protein [Hymenobacter properus]MBF9140894.1 hypothetical protein [Hymenobacter properus]MBR7719703.1 hypothetical protein [Microvirga sp. SRT04]
MAQGIQALGPPRAAVSSLAAGGDLLFALACLRRRIPLHIVLPLRQPDFIGQSVSYAKPEDATVPSPNWLALYKLVLRRATTLHFTSKAPYRACARPFKRCNQAMLHLAQAKAASAHTTVLGVLLLQKDQTSLAGGTQEFGRMLRMKRLMVNRQFLKYPPSPVHLP